MRGMGFASNSVETSEDLHAFEVFTKEHLLAIRKKIPKMEKLRFAQQVRIQLQEELQMLSEALLDTDIVIGDMLKELPTSKSRKYKDCHVQVIIGPDVTKSKSKIISEIGMKKSEARRCEMLWEERDLVDRVRVEAAESGQVATTQRIMRRIREKRKMDKKAKEPHKLPLDPKTEESRKHALFVTGIYKDFNSRLLQLELFKTDEQFFRMLSEFYVRDFALEYDIKRIGNLASKLIHIQNFLCLLLEKRFPQASPGPFVPCENQIPGKIGLPAKYLNKEEGT